MICEACRERRHGECRGGTWCDCQHRSSAEVHAADAEPRQDDGAGPGQDDGAEPAVNWLRQG
jgi:hypothetical protein